MTTGKELGILDKDTLRTPESAQLIGRLLRRRWGLWCGLLLPGGEVLPLGDEVGSPPSLCKAFQGRQNPTGSCERSVRRWSEAYVTGDILAGEVSEVGCHAGLRALLRPLVVGERLLGTLYVSGFWLPSQAQEAERTLIARAQSLEIARPDPQKVPCLSEHARGWIMDLLNELGTSLENAADTAAVARRTDAPRPKYQEIIGHSAPILELFRLLDKVAASDSTVLVQGENGTGKELIARAVHFNSRRRDKNFVVQNCSALNDNLLDSELFGHRRGSFTGANADKQGLFDLAHGGTFFLDEVGDMSATLQVKMLRVLQEGTFVPVGGTVVRKVDVRIIAATNRDLKSMVRDGTFREDLFYRLNVINLVVPALRDRPSDIPKLIEHFLERTCRRMNMHPGQLREDTLNALIQYPWPGNVRELENEVERMVVLAGEGEVITPRLLSPRISGADPRRSSYPSAVVATEDLPGALENLERKMLLAGLQRTGWNKTRAARELGISRRNLIRKVDRYQLDKLRE